MPTNDLVFIDGDYKIVGWLVGMSEEEIAQYREKYKVWSYGHHERFWNEMPKEGDGE